jgi:ribosomal protein L11 methylase PrmA
VNGKLITSNHVYHANTSIDQYIARATLNEGTNEILVKIAQNEQEESWAQRWQFQLRICDEFGTAILPTDRR